MVEKYYKCIDTSGVGVPLTLGKVYKGHYRDFGNIEITDDEGVVSEYFFLRFEEVEVIDWENKYKQALVYIKKLYEDSIETNRHCDTNTLAKVLVNGFNLKPSEKLVIEYTPV